MSANTAPSDLYRRGLQLLLAKDIPAWVDLWDESGVVEFPFAPEGLPKRLEGQAAVAEYKMRGVGRLVDAESPFDMSYLAVVTVKKGLITRYRDYWKPLALPRPATDFAGSKR